jgi:hypothetical protein
MRVDPCKVGSLDTRQVSLEFLRIFTLSLADWFLVAIERLTLLEKPKVGTIGSESVRMF